MDCLKIVQENDFYLFKEYCVKGDLSQGLSYACEYGRTNMVLYLLEHHAMSPNTMYGNTCPLCIVARTGNIEMAQLLVDHHANLNDVGHEISPLIEATYHHQLDMVKWFVDHGSRIYTEDKITGNTALMVACERHDEDMVRYLLSQNVSGILHTNTSKKTALDISVELNDLNITKVLLSHGAVRAYTFSIVVTYATTQSNACQIIEIIQQLIRENKSPNHTGLQCNLLRYIMMYHNKTIFTYLLEHTDIHVNDPCKKETPLHYACYMNLLWAVELLLAHGADTNVYNTYNYSPLYVACSRGYVDIARVLLKHGAAIHSFYLTVAVANNYVDVVKLLFQYGADPTVLISGKTIWQYATQQNIKKPSSSLLCILKDAEHAAETSPENVIESLLYRTHLDAMTWYTLLPQLSKDALHLLLVNDDVDTRACYTALYEGEKDVLDKHRQGETVSFSQAAIRCMGRSYGTRPIRVSITSYLVYPTWIREELSELD
jgi:ankyrin repeat protein